MWGASWEVKNQNEDAGRVDAVLQFCVKPVAVMPDCVHNACYGQADIQWQDTKCVDGMTHPLGVARMRHSAKYPWPLVR